MPNNFNPEVLRYASRGRDKRNSYSPITSASYMRNDKELRPIYSLKDLSSRIEVRNFDYAPTNMSTDFSETSDAVGREILQLYADSGQGNDLSAAHRVAIDTTIAAAFGLDYRDVSRNHKYYVNLFAGEDVEDRAFGEALAKAWERDGVDQDIADLQNRYDASEDEEERARILEEIDGLELKSLQLQDYSDRGWLQNNVVNTAPIVRQLSKTIAYTALGALIGAGIGGMFTGSASTAASFGNILKALNFVKIGATTGRTADAIFNTYARERGSMSRQLFNTIDENGNRMSDSARATAATLYGIGSTMIEYFLPEPGLEKLVPNGLSQLLKQSLFDNIKGASKRLGARILLGATSESTEEALQSLLGDATESVAKILSNRYGVTEYNDRPVHEAIREYISNAYGAFKDAFIPSLFIAIPGAGLEMASDINVTRNNRLYKTTPDQKASAKQFQSFSNSDQVVPSGLIKFKKGKPSDSFIQSITEKTSDGSQGKVRTDGFPAVVVEKDKSGRFVPVDDYNNDLAKYLYNSGAKGIAIQIRDDSTSVTTDDLRNSSSIHNGFFDEDTGNIYTSTADDADAIVAELGASVVNSERIDDNTLSVTYRNEDGKEVTTSIITDSSLADVLTLNEEAENVATSIDEVEQEVPAIDPAVVTEVNAQADSWISRPKEWIQSSEFTKDMAGAIRKAPSEARAVLDKGLATYIRSVNPSMDETQVEAMADANAVLMMHLANAQGRDIADFVEGITNLGITGDNSVRGQYRENAEGKSIVLNPAKMEPLTFSHEVGHYFLQTLPDGELKNRIISTYSNQYNADGRKIGKNLHEAFVKGLTNFMATGQAENAEIRSVFQKLVNAMKAFIDRAKSGLTKKQIALYNSLFAGNTVPNANTTESESSRARRLISKEPIDISDDPTTSETARAVYEGIKTATNEETGMVVEFVKTSFGKIIRHNPYDPRTIGALKELFESSVYMFTEDPDFETPRRDGTLHKDSSSNVIGFSHFANKFRLDGKDYFIRYSVRDLRTRRPDGYHQLHSQQITDIELSGITTRSALSMRGAEITASDSKLASFLSSVNDNELVLNEDVDNLTDEQKALRARIQRGRRAQGQRRSRFFQAIQEMLDNDLYVDTDDLLSAKRNLEQQMQEANTDAFKPVDFSENPEWVKIRNELTMRDKMLLYPKEYLEVARGDKSRAEFVEYVRVNSPDPSSFSETDRRTAEKYYNYVNTPSARTQVQAFVDEYSSLPHLMALKQILGPRRVAAQSQSGRVYTRQYVPTSNVWREISSLTNDSSAAEVQAVLDSIQSNPDEWYQAYLNVLISSAKLGRESVEDTQTNLEAIAMSYYAGKRATGRETFFEKLTARGSESDTDIKKAHDAIDPSTEEGRAAGSIRRGDTFSDTYIEDVVPRITKEVQLEKDRARARESIGRSERAIRRMSNVNLTNTDARFLPVSQWLYSFMHGGRTGIFAELAGSDADIYQDIMEGKESPDASTGQKTLYTFYPDLEPSAEGDPIVPLTYAEYDPYRTVEGFTVDLGGYRFDQKKIPAELKRFLPEDTVDHILSVEKWNDLTAEDIANIADAMKRAKRWAQDIQEEKRRQRTARDRNKSLPVAERLLGKTLQFTDDQLNEIGMKALGLNGKATPQEALDYYRKNPARLLDLYDDQKYDTKGGKILKSIRDRKDDAYLGFIKIQRLARALDGEDNGPIFNMFYRDIFEGYSEMKRQITRRNEEAAKAFAPVLGDHANPNLTSEQKKAEKTKFEKFSEMMNQTVELVSSSNLTGERNTRKLNGYDLLHLYLASKNINGFKKLIDPNEGSGLSLEAMMDYNPESVHEFVDLELRLRELIIKERNRINSEWNGTQLKRMEEDPDYVPQFRSTNLTWDDVKVAYGQKSFIKDRSTADLEKILAESATKESLLNKDIKYIGDKMLELLAKETPRVVTADYQQRNELMTIERNYWPLVNRLRSPGTMLDLFEESGGNKATPSAGFTKTRETEARYDILGQNPFAIFYTAIDQQERFINLGDTMRTIDNMWGPHVGNVSEIVERKYGKRMKQYLYNYFRRMAGKDSFNELIGLESLSALLPRLQGSYIGLSPLTTVRQYVSLINVMSRGEVKTRDLLSSTVRFISNEAYREEVSERVKALAPELYETDITQEIAFQRHMEKMQFKSDTKSAQFRDFCTSWIRYHDRVTKWVTWETVFEQARAEGMSETDAAFKASTTVQETMSVGDPISRSQLQEDKNPLLRYLFMFTTDLFNTWNILFGDAISDWKQGDKMRAMKRLGGFVAMSAALAIIQGGWLPDDDDDEGTIFDLSGFWGDMSQELVNGVPIAGVVLSDILSGYKGGQIPVVSDVLRDANNLFGEDKTAGERIDALVDAMITAGAPFGAPTSSAKRMVNVVYTPDGGFFFNPLAFLNNNYANWYEHLFD